MEAPWRGHGGGGQQEGEGGRGGQGKGEERGGGLEGGGEEGSRVSPTWPAPLGPPGPRPEAQVLEHL